MNITHEVAEKEQRMVRACAELGGIAGCNAHYTHGLTLMLIAEGYDDIEQVTIGELQRVSRAYTDTFNAIRAGVCQ